MFYFQDVKHDIPKSTDENVYNTDTNISSNNNVVNGSTLTSPQSQENGKHQLRARKTKRKD